MADGSRREYRGYNTLTETGYYESFIWEAGKGLVEYRSGYGAGADAVELLLESLGKGTMQYGRENQINYIC